MASSGDLLADRRFAYAERAFADDDFVVTADLARQTLELAPGFAAGWFLLGKAMEAWAATATSDGDAARLRAEAVDAFQAARQLDEEDTLGAGVRLAGLGAAEPSGAMSESYVRTLFDEYAIRFDRHLVEGLHYQAPALLRHALRRACSRALRPFRFEHALDLGCGTGLAAAALRDLCGTLGGVDLSPAMIERARRKRLYDDLSVGDLTGWLRTRSDRSADLAVAADVFVYMADLAPVFAELARVLAPGGLFAFTVQAHEGEGIRLGEDARYAHGEAHLGDLAGAAGFAVALSEPVVTRQDRGRDVPGRLMVLEK
jgi:predicted TPR repeat methyltransferase